MGGKGCIIVTSDKEGLHCGLVIKKGCIVDCHKKGLHCGL